MASQAALESLAAATAARVGVPPALFAGLVQTESAWNPSARSAAGALGLAQVMPQMARAYGYRPEEMLVPEKGLDAGARILRDELSRFGSWELAAMAYNAGSPAVNRAIVKAKSKAPEAVSAALPAAETRAYWRKVIAWGAAYSGAITRAEASVRARTLDVSGAVSAWAKSQTGKASILMAVALVAAAALILAARR